MQFIWNSRSLGNQSEIFTEILANNYWEWGGLFPFETDPVTPQNVQKYALTLSKIVQSRAPWYKTRNYLLEWGADFAFQDAKLQFHSMDQIVEWIQKNPEKTMIEIQYATLSEYFAAVRSDAKKDDIAFPVNNGGDFFPYLLGGPNDWWTGYFTSRSELKGWVRKGESASHCVEGLFSLGRNFLKFDHESVLGRIPRL